MHHLTAGEDGQAGPDFHYAALWSPAYQWAFDRRGSLENSFKAFAKKAGCDATLSCLRKASVSTLRNANQAIVNASLDTGIFPFGPALDGSYVKYLPSRMLYRMLFTHSEKKPREKLIRFVYSRFIQISSVNSCVTCC